MAAWLLKSAGIATLDSVTVPLPTRARPARLPGSGDTVYLWANAIGLVEEVPVLACNGATLQTGAATRLSPPLAASWLDGADRRKQTLRSKLHCDRHDRLWFLSEAALHEIDRARGR